MATDRLEQPPPLNVQPTGLLSFLQIKNGGRYPQYLRDELLPVWDLARHYEACNAETRPLGAADLQVAGVTTYLISTTTNTWRHVLWVGCTWTGNNAADLIQGDFCIREPVTLQSFAVPNQRPFAVDAGGYHRVYGIAGAGATVVRANAFDFWIPPGWDLVLAQNSGVITGAPTLWFGRSIVEYKP